MNILSIRVLKTLCVVQLLLGNVILAQQDFTITSPLCSDEQGPDCTKLRLGDDYLTTSTPAKGYLYSCVGKNPNAPGAIESKITWINFVENNWNFFKKLWLPSGTFNPATGTYAEMSSGDKRSISVNNLPVDGMIGDWPMTNYPTLTEIDPNPGIPAASNSSFSYPTSPSEASSPTCVNPGAIGVTTNGVVIYNAADGRGEDAVAHEIVDKFGGHPARSHYHYHFIPERLDNTFLSDGHSGIVGYINDGFPIYGYKGDGGVEMSNDDLDLCHGHQHGTLGYHYHATVEYPYTVGCYKGIPVTSSSIGEPPPRGGPPPILPDPVTANKELFFPHFADGSGLSSKITLVNLSATESVTGSITLFADTGDPLTVDLNGQTVIGEQSLTVPAGGAAVFTTDGVGVLQAGAVTVSSDQPLAGVVLFAGERVGVAGISNSPAASSFIAPVEMDVPNGILTGVAIMNLESTAQTIQVELNNLSGDLITTGTLGTTPLAGNGHVARYLNDPAFQFSGFPNLSVFQGVLKVTVSGGQIAGTVIRQSPGEFATLPVTKVP